MVHRHHPDCPFEIVLNDNFTIEENNIVINETFQILLKIIEKTNWCSQNMYSTTEGLYIIDNPNNNSNLLEKLNFNTGKLSELTTINDLILTDTDFKIRQLLVIDKIFNQNICKLQQSIIRSFKSHIDTYHIIQLKNKPMIIYSTGQNVYIPTCIPIQKITLIEQTENCYNDLPIQFDFINHTKYGYLTSNLIIKDTSYLKLCNLINDYIILPLSKRIIERINNKVNILSQSNQNILQLSISSIDINTINFKHNPQIAKGIDIQSIYKNIIYINDSGTILKIIEDGPTTLFQNQLLTQESFQKHLASLLMRHFVPYMFLFASIILLKVIIIYCILRCIIRAVRKCIDNTTKNNNNNNQNLSYSNETQEYTNHNKLLSIGKRFTIFKYHRKRHENKNLDDIELRQLNANLIN